jgi:SulP family sulfate permease
LNKSLRYLPFLDLRSYRSQDLLPDISAALAITFLAVPQAVAYAIIAGLPPVMGLYAATVPVVVGSLFRSSRLVVTGPTNAVSLLVGSALLGSVEGDPYAKATTLALMVGVLQLSAGVLRLAALLDYISKPVLLGFITGAGLLIGTGQLHHATRTAEPEGHLLFTRLWLWAQDLPGAHWPSLALALGCVVLVVGLRRLDRRIPGATVAMVGATALSMIFDWSAAGMEVVSDIAPVRAELPTFSLPSAASAQELLPIAGAVAMLSLVETSAVAKAIAARSRQRLDTTVEFIGEGLANITASLFSGYPTAGSLSRSSLNEVVGGRTRLAGVAAGLLALLVLRFLGELINYTPIACLAGILFVVAWRLVEVHDIRRTLGSHWGDRLSFLVTLLATWMLHLDEAIYLGVGLSLVMFLRKERLLSVRDLVIDADGRMRDVAFAPIHGPEVDVCRAIHMVNLEGPMFFGAASELSSMLDFVTRHRQTRVLVLRLKRTDDLDVTTALILEEVASQLQSEGRQLILVGMREHAMRILEGTGVAASIGEENLFPSEDRWYAALEDALRRALRLVGEHPCGDSCAIRGWLEVRGHP